MHQSKIQLTEDFIKKAITIGKSGICSDDDLDYFLPNRPQLRGSEMIFTIGWSNAKDFLLHTGEDCESFIKGLHYVELKYASVYHPHIHDQFFGFGSPSPTWKLINALEAKSSPMAGRLKNWISENGGNYYIEPLRNDDGSLTYQ